MRHPERFFDLLLRLLPRRFHDRFGSEMRSSFRAEHAEAKGEGRVSLGFWVRAIAGILILAPREHLSDLLLDLRFASRTLRRQPGFLASAALSLAVGIGATATAISIFSATFGRDAPGVRAPAGLVNVGLKTASDDRFRRTSYPNYTDLRDSGALASLAGFHGLRLSWATGEGEEASTVFAQLVSDNYFTTLGARALRGRMLNAGDREQRLPVAVISEHLWRNRLGGEEHVLGSTVRLNGEPFTIVGIAEEGFRGHFIGFRFDVFLPLAMSSVASLPDLQEREGNWVELVGRLPADARGEEARTRARDRLRTAALRLADAFPEVNRDLEVEIERYDGFDEDFRGGLATFLALLFGVSTFVLLIACVNVANLMSSRVLRRRREMSVRLALGAPRGRLVRQLLTESALIAVVAGGLGAAMAMGTSSLVRRTLLERTGGIHLDIRLDPATLAAVMVLSCSVALVFGLIPALRGSQGRQGIFVRGQAAEAGAGKVRGILVVGQVALSLVILIAAGLFIRALGHASRLEPGFDTEGILAVSLNTSLAGMDAVEAGRFFDRLTETVALQAGVAAAGLTDRLALGLGARFFSHTVEVGIPGAPVPEGREGIAIEHAAISPGYLEALGIPVLSGRTLDRRDGRERPAADGSGGPEPIGAAVVNETFAERYFPRSEPLGKFLRIDGRPVEVVGIARDSLYRTLDEAPMPFLYLPSPMTDPRSVTLLVKPAKGAAGDLALRLREIVRELAPELPISTVGQLESVLEVSLLPQRIAATAAGAMGLVGLFMSALGLFGVLSYSVTCRRAEIGVRLSLGARPVEIVRMILAQALALAAFGLLAGVPLALATSRLLASFLYGISPLDLLTYGAICAIMALTATLAAFVPASRAASIDPLRVLRES